MNEQNAERRAATGVQITVPNHWWELPLDRQARDDAIAGLVDERIALTPRLSSHRDGLVAMLRAIAAGATSLGAVYCAQAAFAGRRGSSPATAAVTANVLIVISQSDNVGNRSLLDWVIRQTAVQSSGRPPREDHEATVVDLPLAGQAVRLRTIHPYAHDRGTDIQGLLIQYFVPVPGGNGIALITFSSPSAGHARQLTELFDAMADTFAFTDADGEVVVADTPSLRVQ